MKASEIDVVGDAFETVRAVREPFQASWVSEEPLEVLGHRPGLVGLLLPVIGLVVGEVLLHDVHEDVFIIAGDIERQE